MQRLWSFSNFVRDIGADAGDRDNRVDMFLLCGESELDGGRGDNFGDEERTSPFVVQFLHGAPQSTESLASLDRPIGAIFECLKIGRAHV